MHGENIMADTSSNYLAQYDAAADVEKFALVQRWIATEPLPFFKELREKRPVFVTPGATLIACFDDIREVLLLPTIFTVAPYLPKMSNGIYLMAHDNDALHTREKSLMQALLNRDDLPQVRAMVANIAKKILDAANCNMEIVNQFCRMVPATLVQDYFGLDGADKKNLIEWSYWAQYDTFHNQPFDSIPAEKKKYVEQQHARTGDLLNKYIAKLIVRRSLALELEKANLLRTLWLKLRILVRLVMGKQHDSTLRDDMVTRMLRSSFPEAVDFDIKRLGVNAGGLLIGAIETTSQAVAQVLQYFLQRPDLLAQAKTAAQNKDPSAFDAMVWEALRFVPIAPYLFRKTASAYTLASGTDNATTIPAGSYVLTLTQSAMFDPRAFTDPEEFRSDRNWYHHFNFGFGSHECLGKYIGMVMIPEMARQVLLRPGIQAQSAIDYKDGPFPEAYQLTWN
jgi:cytochrome P450